ncbi:MAG: STAS domain-containing protein, partial [Acidobacteriota bacterium]
MRPDKGGVLVSLAGTLDVDTAARARQQVAAGLDGSPVQCIEVDASGIDRGDMSGMSLLYELAEGRLVPGVHAKVRGLRPEFQALLAAFPTAQALDGMNEAPASRSVVREVGAATQSMFADGRAQIVFIGGVVQAFGAILRRPRMMRWREVAVIFEKAGVNALPIVSLISLLTGLIIAFESAQPLE